MDLFSRKIIAWNLAETMEVSTVVTTINKAKSIRQLDIPVIIQTDRGSQYVSADWRIATEGMQRSYSHSGYPYDNACIESFHSLIKREWLNRFSIRNYDHARALVFEYIEAFYNTIRIHSHCGYISPDNYEKMYERSKTLITA
jgi:transposase InsO family protein